MTQPTHNHGQYGARRRRSPIRALSCAAASVSLVALAAACGSSSSKSTAAPTTAASSAGQQSFVGKTVTFGGPAADIISDIQATGFPQKFESATGAKIQWIPGSAPSNLQQLVQSKGSSAPFDVVDLDAGTQVQAIDDGVLQKFSNSSSAFNVPGLPADAYIHPGYGPLQIILRLGSCINTAAYQQHGIQIPTSIQGWWDPKLAGHIALPGPNNFYWPAVMPALAQSYGIAMNDPQKLIDKFKQIKVTAFYTSSAEAQTDLTDGTDWLTATSDGRCEALKKAGQPVQFIPLNLQINGKTWGYVGSGDTLDVVAGSPNQALSLEFIRQLTYYYGLAGMNNLGYIPTLPSLQTQGKSNPKMAPLLASFNANDVYYPSVSTVTAFNDNERSWVNAWNATFLR